MNGPFFSTRAPKCRASTRIRLSQVACCHWGCIIPLREIESDGWISRGESALAAAIRSIKKHIVIHFLKILYVYRKVRISWMKRDTIAYSVEYWASRVLSTFDTNCPSHGSRLFCVITCVFYKTIDPFSTFFNVFFSFHFSEPRSPTRRRYGQFQSSLKSEDLLFSIKVHDIRSSVAGQKQ